MPTVTEKTKTKPLLIRDCGLADYRQILQLQHELRDKRRAGQIPNVVLIVEHPPVITLGARKSANKLLISQNDIKKKGIDVVEIRRGGGITAHNPGQLVFYPIMHLQQLKLGISEYVLVLEKIGINLLRQLGVQSQIRKGLPGLWVGDKKIASVGVRISKFVTCHGMAINIQNDLDIFDLFVPCGLEEVRMTSVYKLTGGKNSMSQIKENLADLLRSHFSGEMDDES